MNRLEKRQQRVTHALFSAGPSRGCRHHTSVSGDRQSQNSASSVDQTTQGRMGQIWDAGQASGASGPSPLLTGAAGYNSGLMGAGQTGTAAASGDPAAMQKLMNPYTSNVIDQNNNQWQRINQQTMNATDDRATQAGAFGGSRHGVAEGVALGQNNQAQAQQNAGLLQNGYFNAQGQANTLSQMGAYGAGQNSNLGFGGVGSPDQWRLQQMKQGFMGPTGQTSSGASAGTHFDAGFHMFGM